MSFGRAVRRRRRTQRKNEVLNDMLRSLDACFVVLTDEQKNELREALGKDFKPTELKMLRKLLAEDAEA